MKISKKTQEFMRHYYPYVKVRKNEVIMKEPVERNPMTMTVPSDLYPLRNRPTMKVFTYVDTVQLEQDSPLANVYNRCSFEIGHCYSNIELLEREFHKQNIRDVSTYVGWLVYGGSLVHHCWLVYKDKYVFDPGITKIDEIAKDEIVKRGILDDYEKRRQVYKEIYEEYIQNPNSALRTFGQVAPFAVYIGTECTPEQGRTIFKDLIQKYPEHPAYQYEGMNAHGASTLQKMLAESDKGKDKNDE